MSDDPALIADYVQPPRRAGSMPDQLQNADCVRLLCPLCRWESDAERVVVDEPNGLWQARQRRLADYHEHFASAHRPPPLSALTEERTHA